MSEAKHSNGGPQSEARLKKSEAEAIKEPVWTRGLKRLYDEVLEEPLPQTFKDLLSKLDDDRTS